MTTPRLSKSIAAAPAYAGVAVWAYICIFESSLPRSLVLLVLAVLPYAVCLSITYSQAGRPYYGFFGSLGALLGDALIIHSVFVSPTSSTSALALLAVPLANFLFFIPGGLLLGFVIQLFWRERAAP